jgi:hypothetical protein
MTHLIDHLLAVAKGKGRDGDAESFAEFAKEYLAIHPVLLFAPSPDGTVVHLQPTPGITIDPVLLSPPAYTQKPDSGSIPVTQFGMGRGTVHTDTFPVR